MPTGPKGQKRPADVIGNAVKIALIVVHDDASNERLRRSSAMCHIDRAMPSNDMHGGGSWTGSLS